MEFKLGKTAPKPVALKLRAFTNPSELPKPPKHFGHETLIQPRDWGMLGNDTAGDCVIAAKMHLQKLMCAMGGSTLEFTTQNALDLYTTLTGYNPNDPNTDNGTDMRAAAGYWRNTGITDAKGNVHKIEAYISFDPSNVTELYQALYLFGNADIGIQFPVSAMEQFNKGKTWSVVKNSRIEGGHDVCLVAKRKSIECVTWGAIQPMTVGFYGKYNDESFVYISKEQIINQKSPEGFDYDKLIEYINQLK